MVEFQPSKLAVAGSNPVARSSEDVNREASLVKRERAKDLNPRQGGSEGGEPPSWGAREGAGPLCGSREASFRADAATERGSNPVARSSERGSS